VKGQARGARDAAPSQPELPAPFPWEHSVPGAVSPSGHHGPTGCCSSSHGKQKINQQQLLLGLQRSAPPSPRKSIFGRIIAVSCSFLKQPAEHVQLLGRVFILGLRPCKLHFFFAFPEARRSGQNAGVSAQR